MLGKLARWMRHAGWDTAYDHPLSDEILLYRSRQENRIILTRDTKLIRRLKPQEYLFITKDHLPEQFEELLKTFPQLPNSMRPLSRCGHCNSPLDFVAKEKIKEKVWPYVFQTQEHFTQCPNCGHLYWNATHVKRIKGRLQDLVKAV